MFVLSHPTRRHGARGCNQSHVKLRVLAFLSVDGLEVGLRNKDGPMSLERYRERGLFPENRQFIRRTPTFVDAREVHCALAHLIGETGGRQLVERVASLGNHAYVRDLARDAELVEWLDVHGFTLVEAARIQPSYDSPHFKYGGFCNGHPIRPLLRATLVDARHARVTAVFSEGAPISVGTVIELGSKKGKSIAAGNPISGHVVGEDVLLMHAIEPLQRGGDVRFWMPTTHKIKGGSIAVGEGHSLKLADAAQVLQSEQCPHAVAALVAPPRPASASAITTAPVAPGEGPLPPTSGALASASARPASSGEPGVAPADSTPTPSGSCSGCSLLASVCKRGNVNSPGTVSYTHLTLPTNREV